MSITDILDKRGITYKSTNNPSEILLQCTSGEHEDTNPSLSFNLEKGIFNCWSCGFRGGELKFLQSIGEEPYIDISSKQAYKVAKLKQKLNEKLEISNVRLPDDRKVFRKEYRDITAKTFIEFQAFTSAMPHLDGYLCIPVYQHKKLKFIEGRRLKDLENMPKYMRTPKGSKVNNVLFPLDKIKNTNRIILVEGIFDLLNLWDLGYNNTLCIFGASSFNATKASLLDSRGITSVDILMDPDRAGKKAAESIMTVLDKKDIRSRILQLPAGTDPGELTKLQADQILG